MRTSKPALLVFLLVTLASAARAANRHGYVPALAPSAVSVFETATRLPVETISLERFESYGPRDIATASSVNLAFVAVGCEVAIIDTATNHVRSSVALPGSCCAERVATNPDGRAVAVADSDCARIWMIDGRRGRVIAQSERFPGAHAIEGVAVSVDGAEAFTVVEALDDDEDDTSSHVVVLDTATAAILRERRLGHAYDGELALSVDGETLLLGGWAGYSLHLVNRRTLDVQATIPLTEPAGGSVPWSLTAPDVRGIVASPDGALFAVVLTERYSDPSLATSLVQTYNASTNALVARVRIDAASGRPAIDPDTGLVYVPVRDALGRVAVIDPVAGTLIEQFQNGEEPAAIAFGPGERPLVTPAPTPRPARIPSPAPMQLCAYITHEAADPRGGALTAVNASEHVVSRVLPFGSADADARGGGGAGTYGVALSPDGHTVYATSGEALLAIDTASGLVEHVIPIGSGGGPVAVRPDGAVAYVGKPNAVGVVDLTAGSLVDAFFTHGTPTGIAFTPDGDLAYITRRSDSDTVLVVDARAHAVLATVTVSDGRPCCYTSLGNHVAVAPDGNSLFVGVDHADSYEPSRVAVIDRGTQRVRGRWTLPVAGAPAGIAVDPDGARVYVAIGPRYVCRDDPTTGYCVWRPDVIAVLDATTGTPQATVAIGGYLGEIAVSPDGSALYALDTVYGLATVIDLDTLAIAETLTIADLPGRLTLGLAAGGCPTRGAIGPLRTRTPTATWPPRYTATPTPVVSPTPSGTPSPAQCDPPCVAVEVDSAVGRPGERVTVAVRLRTDGLAVAGIDNEITWTDGISIPELRQQRPDCRVNPAIDKNATQFRFVPPYYYDGFGPFPCWLGFDCTGVRALVLAVDNVAPIPDGVMLYECVVSIAPDATPGRYPLRVAGVQVTDPDGRLLPAIGVDGVVEVGADDPYPALQQDTSTGTGCAIGPREKPTTAWWPLLSLALLAGARCARRNQPGRRHSGHLARSGR